ncbi:MAG: hypothetical protein RLZZ301_679 [Bacteroidota bacterium]|jgi:hypothetical protein
MKITALSVVTFALSLSLYSCKSSAEALKHYGPEKVSVENAITLDQMVAQYKANPAQDQFTFQAPLVAVCQSAGCWVNVKPTSGDMIRVRFKNHFVIPPATELGSVAIFHGRAYYDTLSVALQKHFLEDAKAPQSEIDKITTPKIELNFEADGVLVKKTSSGKSHK